MYSAQQLPRLRLHKATGPDDLRRGMDTLHSGTGFDTGRDQDNSRVDRWCSALRQPLQPHRS